MKPDNISHDQCSFQDEPSHVKLEEILENRYSNFNLHQIEVDILNQLKLEYKVNEIMINQNEFLHTIIIYTTVKEHKHRVIFVTHGFGGTSLMFFPLIKTLLLYGNVVLWEIRGMGFSKKLPKYDIDAEHSEHFFVEPIELMLKFYTKFTEIYFIGHSFGGYLILLYLNKFKTFTNKIKEVILLSPVGITPKEEDYKSKVQSFSDCFHVIGNKISWFFGITYKSPFRCICACFKNKVFGNAVKNCGYDEIEEEFMKRILLELVNEKDGSESVFFNYFLPRVLPRYPIYPIYMKNPPETNISIFYGGEEDWVDKTSAEKLKTKYPNKISIRIIKESGHNFPFFPQLLKTIFAEILSRHENIKDRSESNQVKVENEKKTENEIHDLLGHEIDQNNENIEK